MMWQRKNGDKIVPNVEMVRLGLPYPHYVTLYAFDSSRGSDRMDVDISGVDFIHGARKVIYDGNTIDIFTRWPTVCRLDKLYGKYVLTCYTEEEE